MSKENGTSLPSEYFRAFARANETYGFLHTLGDFRQLTVDELQDVFVQYFTSGLQFLINEQTDSYLQKIAFTAWEAMHTHIVATYVVTDMKQFARTSLGKSDREVQAEVRDVTKPTLFYLEKPFEGGVVAESLLFVVQPDFFIKTRKYPLLALCDMAGALCGVRDFALQRQVYEDASRTVLRSTVAKAQVLFRGGYQGNPPIKPYVDIWSSFPHGFASESLSMPLWYEGKLSPTIRNPLLN